ncbi:MAG: hypothetical protein K9N38_01985 [Candidatus Marinimicrobia bacterium]|nr:hypothetical protein [Candidatus Neomarinimicrobiota bacterium]MCF7850194.1 hypothetical protein [Candidatus Neomarinimicrobiota bacterium]
MNYSESVNASKVSSNSKPAIPSITTLDVLLFFVENLKTTLIVPFIFGVLSIVYVLFIAEPVYLSSSTLLPTQGSDVMSEMRGLASQFGLSIPGDNESTDFASKEMYIQILKSRRLASALLEKRVYSEIYDSEMDLLSYINYGNEENTFGLAGLKEIAIQSIKENILEVVEDGSSPLLILKIRSKEPGVCTQINSLVLAELDSMQKEFKLNKSMQKKAFIESRIENVRKELEKSELDLLQFRERNRQIQNSPTLMLEQERLTRDINVQVGVFTTLKQQLEMAKIETVQSQSFIQVLDPPNHPLLPEEPNKKLVVILATMFGGAFGISIALARNRFKRIQQEESSKLLRIKSLLKIS